MLGHMLCCLYRNGPDRVDNKAASSCPRAPRFHLSDLHEGGTKVRQDVPQALCLLRRERLCRRRSLHLAREEPAPEREADLPTSVAECCSSQVLWL